MTYRPEYSIDHVRQQCEKLAKDGRKNLNALQVVRVFRAMKWKYQSNDSYRLLVDSVMMFCSLGVLVAFICFIHYLFNT